MLPIVTEMVIEHEHLHSYSELSKSKAIGITIETRPDYCLLPHLR